MLNILILVLFLSVLTDHRIVDANFRIRRNAMAEAEESKSSPNKSNEEMLTTTILRKINYTSLPKSVLLRVGRANSMFTFLSELLKSRFLMHLMIGIIMLILSALCFILNLVVIRIIVADNELCQLSSYKFMLALNAVDCAMSGVHFVTGLFTIYEDIFQLWLSQCLGAIATPSYIFYIIVTIVLALNRLIILTSERLEQLSFSQNRIMFWFLLPALISLGFVGALCSPWAAICYLPDQFSWAYDTNRPLSKLVENMEEIVEVGGIPIAGLIYTAIFFTILYKSVTTYGHMFMLISFPIGFKRVNGLILRQTGTVAETKVLIQASIITAYCTVLNFLWHNSDWLLPNTRMAKCALNLMWIGNGAVNPLICLAVNAAIRRRIVPSFGTVPPPAANGQQLLPYSTTVEVLPALRLTTPFPLNNNFLTSNLPLHK